MRSGKKFLKTLLLHVEDKSKLKQAQKYRSFIFVPGYPLEYNYILNHDYAEEIVLGSLIYIYNLKYCCRITE